MSIVIFEQTRVTRRVVLTIDRLGVYLTFWEGDDELAGVTLQWGRFGSRHLRRGVFAFSTTRQELAKIVRFDSQPDGWYTSNRMLGY